MMFHTPTLCRCSLTFLGKQTFKTYTSYTLCGSRFLCVAIFVWMKFLQICCKISLVLNCYDHMLIEYLKCF